MSTEPAIWDYFRRTLDPTMLYEIAAGDYETATAQHLIELEKILNSGRLPDFLDWEPREALSLYSWSKAEVDDSRTHTMRLFSCVVLLAASASSHSNEHLWQQADKLIIAIDSAVCLGQAQLLYLDQFLLDLLPRLASNCDETDRLFFYIGVALLAQILQKTAAQQDFFLQQASIAEQAYLQASASDRQDQVLAYLEYSLRLELWQAHLAPYANKWQTRPCIAAGDQA